MHRAVVFAHYDKYNSIQEYVLYYLKELRKVADTIIFVSDSNLPESEISKVQPLVKLVIATPHGEYDFGSYKRGFIHIPDDTDELIFANDSCLGPLYSLDKVFDEMQDKQCDFWGMNSHCIDVDFHIQSFFMVFKKEVFRSDLFKNFISSIEKQKHKDDIILNYEVGLSQLLLKNGYKAAAFIEKSCEGRVNGSLFFPDKLNPLVKTRVVRQSGWFLGMLLSSWYNNFEIDYPKNLIFDYAKKYKEEISLFDNLTSLRKVLFRMHLAKKEVCLLGRWYRW